MPEVVIGAGTNLGDRLSHLRRGVRALRRLIPVLDVRAISPIYESDALIPAGAPPGWNRPYLNLAVRARWAGDPLSLLARLKVLEEELGRRPRERWGPREVDFDLLTFDELALAEPSLTLPHPGLGDRPFALLPVADVAPEWRFPEGSGPHAGRSAAQAASPWRADPESVPLRTRRTFLSLTEIAGVLNLTPDSFSDGGAWVDPATAIGHAKRLATEGATVLDLGAESTRPGAEAVDPDTEWRRLKPVLEALAEAMPERGPVLSVDTRHPETARRAIEAGAGWINDVTGFTEPGMLAAVADSPVDLVVMHSLGIPPSRERTLPPDRDPVGEILAWAEARLAALMKSGVARERVVLDPGIGFGKTAAQSAELVRRAGELMRLGVRVLVGHSRKSFLAEWYPEGHPGRSEPAARDHESAVLSGHLALSGVDYVRVHDVAATASALRTTALAGTAVR